MEPRNFWGERECSDGGSFDALQQPCVYVVYKTEPDRWLWYHQALEIVQETLEFVLANPSPDYLLHWSS